MWTAALLAAGGAAVAADTQSTASAARDRALPDRWSARRVREPVFGSRMYLVEAGPADAAPVVLVHGLGRSGYQDWWETIDALERDYRVIAVDLPGFGRSSLPEGALSPSRYARLLDWLLAELDLRSVRLVGHSMGGAVALRHAADHPGRIEQVVLVDVAGILQRVAFLRAVASSKVAEAGLPALVERSLQRLLDWGGDWIEGLAMMPGVDLIDVLRSAEPAWDALLADRPNANAAISLLESDFSHALARFDHPVTIIWGERDDVAPMRIGHLLHGSLAPSRLAVIDAAGHAPMRSQTGAFLEHLRHALADPPTRDGPTLPGVDGEDERPDFTCRGRSGETISGVFDRIVIDDCPGMRLERVRARSIRVSRSSRVDLRHVRVDAGRLAPGLEVTGAEVTATDVHVRGEPAVRLDGARLDLAGGRIASAGAGLRVASGSSVVVSVTRLDSAVRAGFLHGAVEAASTTLDAADGLRTPPVPGLQARAPTPTRVR